MSLEQVHPLHLLNPNRAQRRNRDAKASRIKKLGNIKIGYSPLRQACWRADKPRL